MRGGTVVGGRGWFKTVYQKSRRGERVKKGTTVSICG